MLAERFLHEVAFKVWEAQVWGVVVSEGILCRQGFG
jgi:hypothetical protein